MAAHGTGTMDDATISDDIIHRLQGLGVGTSDAAALSRQQPTSSSNAAVVTSGCSMSSTISKHRIMVAKLRRRRLRQSPPTAASITEELQGLTVGDGGRGGGFRPTGQELIGRFLRAKIAGKPLPPRAAGFFHDADVYAAAPGDLAATHAAAPPRPGGQRPVWYFFSPLHYNPVGNRRRLEGQTNRRVGAIGIWRASGSYQVREKEGGGGGWYVRGLLYRDVVDKNRESRNGWQMREYGIISSGRQQLVLCEVYKVPMGGKRIRKPAMN